MSDDRSRWMGEFPYRWDDDEAVTRRQLLRFAVYTSGALFAGAAGIGVLAVIRRGPVAAATTRVVDLAELAEGEARYFRYPGPEDQAVLIRLRGGELVAYSQRCPHLSCAVVYQRDAKRLYCPCHDGVFELHGGVPVAGPPRRPLTPIRLRRDGNVIYAVGMAP